MCRIGTRAEEIRQNEVIVRPEIFDEPLRAGDTVAEPFLMALKDVTMYAVVISKFGNAKMAVTTSMNINFLGRLGPGISLAFGRALKVGKRLAVIN